MIEDYEQDYPDARDYELAHKAQRSHHRQNRKARREAQKETKV